MKELDFSENKVGRPSAKAKDLLALEDCISTPDKREALLFAIKRHAQTKTDIENKQRFLREDIKSDAEVFGLSAGKFSALVKDYLNDDLDELIQIRTAEVDVLTVISEAKDGDQEDE